MINLECSCLVRRPGDGRGCPGTLSTVETKRCGVVAVVRLDGELIAPHDVQAVFIGQDCPAELMDLAVDSGFFVLGIPGKAVRP